MLPGSLTVSFSILDRIPFPPNSFSCRGHEWESKSVFWTDAPPQTQRSRRCRFICPRAGIGAFPGRGSVCQCGFQDHWNSKSFLASSPDLREVIFIWSFCIQPSISEPDSLKTWNTTAILLCPVHSLITVKLNHRWNLKGFIQSLSSKPASKESSEFLPHAVFIYSPKKCLWSTNRFWT